LRCGVFHYGILIDGNYAQDSTRNKFHIVSEEAAAAALPPLPLTTVNVVNTKM